MVCLSVYTGVQVPSGNGGSDTLELDLQELVNHPTWDLGRSLSPLQEQSVLFPAEPCHKPYFDIFKLPLTEKQLYIFKW